MDVHTSVCNVNVFVKSEYMSVISLEYVKQEEEEENSAIFIIYLTYLTFL